MVVCHYFLAHFECRFFIAEVLLSSVLQQVNAVTLSRRPLMFINDMMKQSNPLSPYYSYSRESQLSQLQLSE